MVICSLTTFRFLQCSREKELDSLSTEVGQCLKVTKNQILIQHEEQSLSEVGSGSFLSQTSRRDHRPWGNASSAAPERGQRA